MSRRNEALEAAKELLQGYTYRTELTRDRHIKLMIDGAKKVVYISSAAKSREVRWIANVKQDVRHAIRTITS
jgi:hypothetical protein